MNSSRALPVYVKISFLKWAPARPEQQQRFGLGTNVELSIWVGREPTRDPSPGHK